MNSSPVKSSAGLIRAGALAALTALTAPAALAGGYYTSDIGVRSFSRGGAFVAGNDDITALWYNPAALIRMKHGQVTIDAAGVYTDVYFDRDDYPGEGPDGGDLINDPVENLSGAFVIPHLGAAWDFGLPNTVFAFGFYPPYAPDLSYDPNGAQRYSMTDSAVIQTFTGISAAHRFKDMITVGGGVSWNYLYVEQELNVTLSTVTDFEADDQDVRFRMDATDNFAIAWNLGFLVEPPSGRWAVGGMVQAPTAFDATGSMSADFSDNVYYTDDGLLGVIANPTAEDDEVKLEVSMPLIARAGVLVRPIDQLEIELAGVYEGWSIIEQIVITDVDMLVEMKEDAIVEDALIEDDIVLPAGYQDVFSVRLGGELAAADWLDVRLGGQFETSAIPASVQSVALIDGNKWGVGAGFTGRPVENLEIDLGAFRSWIPEKHIQDSELYQIAVDPFTGEVLEGRVIGNGVLSATNTLIGGGLNWHFGARD